MNQWNYPEVSDWKIDFQNAQFTPNGQFSHYYTVKTIQLSGTHYLNLKTDGTPDAGFFTVSGINDQGVTVVTEGPIIIWHEQPGESYLYCTSGCEGKKYAYQINLGGHSSWGNQSVFYPTGLIKPQGSSSPYYYEWFSDQQFLAMTTTPGVYYAQFYGLSGNNGQMYSSLNGLGSSDPHAQRVIKLENISAQAGNPYRDANGNVLTGTIYGVRKAFGDYRETIPYMESAMLAGTETHCLGFNYGLAQINANKSNWKGGNGVSLDCNGRRFDGVDNGGGTSGPAVAAGLGDNLPCLVVIKQYTSPVTGQTITWEDCVPRPTVGGGGPSRPNIPAEAEVITLFSLDPGKPLPPLVLKNQQSTRQLLDGTPYPDNQVLLEGLYYALYQMPDGSFLTHIFEASHTKENIDISPLATKFSAIVSPNPVTLPEINVAMTAMENLTVEMAVINPNGTEMAKHLVVLVEDENKTEKISLPLNAAKGVYSLIFRFVDGSVLTKQIVKL
jgi:hypothetical protein